jgi:hypothetical protein
MPVQLRLLDDETLSRRSLVWSQLPEEVRATLIELLAKLLLESVCSGPRQMEDDNESQ